MKFWKEGLSLHLERNCCRGSRKTRRPRPSPFQHRSMSETRERTWKERIGKRALDSNWKVRMQSSREGLESSTRRQPRLSKSRRDEFPLSSSRTSNEARPSPPPPLQVLDPAPSATQSPAQPLLCLLQSTQPRPPEKEDQSRQLESLELPPRAKLSASSSNSTSWSIIPLQKRETTSVPQTLQQTTGEGRTLLRRRKLSPPPLSPPPPALFHLLQ